MKAVGILGSATGDPYWLRLVQSLAQALNKDGAHALCFLGGIACAPYFRDPAGRTALPQSCDAWVLLSSTLRLSASELEPIARTGRACVSIGVEVAGTPTLTSSDETGVFQAVAHLARRHARRRIAFIGGPSASDEATRRLGAYRMALDSVGLESDPTLIASGDYEPSSGREAVRQLELRARRYDAIVAANDLMAMGAIDALKAAGRRVPDDVSVIGFDDLEEASFASPALTTVRQPLPELGATAARFALELASGAEVEPSAMVTAPLVIRESCGCRAESDGPERRPSASVRPATAAQGLRETALRELVSREFATARLRRELARLGDGIVAASDFQEIAPRLDEASRLLNLSRLVLATYSGGGRHARVILESRGSSVVFHQHAESYPLEQLVPASWLAADRPLKLVLSALELGEEQLGYLLFEGDFRDLNAYLDLRRILSSALGRIAQSRELRRLYASERKRA